MTPISASKDSAWVRAKRALAAEGFTLDVQDSAGGRLAGTSYPSATAKVGTASACHVRLALAIRGTPGNAELTSASRWLAQQAMAVGKADLCEQDLKGTQERLQLVVAPVPN